MIVNRQYLKEIRDELGYSATWLPSNKLNPGDIGRITNYQFELLSSLDSFNISTEIIEDDNELHFTYATQGSVSINVKAAGEAPLIGSGLVQADFGVSVAFSKEDAIVFQASKCKRRIIKNQADLEEKILKLFVAKKWNRDFVLVTEVISAEHTTILISSGKNSHLDLKANGNLSLGVKETVDLNSELEVKNESNLAMKIIASKGLTPLFKAIGVKKGLSKPSIRKESEDKLFSFDTFNQLESNSISTEQISEVDYKDFCSL